MTGDGTKKVRNSDRSVGADGGLRRSNAQEIARDVEVRLAAAGDPETAAAQRAYMKSAMRFHGVPTKVLHAEARRIANEHADLDHDGFISILRALWETEWWDLRSVAISLLDRKQKALLGPADLEMLADLCRDAACWAHVDELAAHVVGGILRRHPDERSRYLRAWAADDTSFWVRRTALLGQLRELREGGGDFALFEEIAVPMLGDKEFFIRKAIGWVLRDVSKKRPELTRGFVERHRDRMSGLSLREATRHL